MFTRPNPYRIPSLRSYRLRGHVKYTLDKYLRAYLDDDDTYERHWAQYLNILFVSDKHISTAVFAYLVPTALADTKRYAEENGVDYLVHHKSRPVEYALENPQCPVGLLEMAMDSPMREFRFCAMQNPNCPEHLKVHFYLLDTADC